MAKFNPTRHPSRLLWWLILLLLTPVSMAQTADPVIPATYALVGENAAFQLYVDDTTLAFKLLNKANGYLWHSGLDEPIDGDKLNSSWRAFAKSGLSIEYFDKRATNSRKSIANTEHTLTMTPIEQGVAAVVTFTEYGITLGVNLYLEADGVRVELPYTAIREENPDFRLARVYLYPFLGATRGGSVDGYLFLPDGVGSLVQYADSTKARNMFYGRYYDIDLGMTTYEAYNPYTTQPLTLSMPVFGAVHGAGESALFSFIESGAAYGALNLHPAGIITNFNFAYHSFIYNESYFQATNRSGAGVTVVQRQTNVFDAVVHYHFLSGPSADYVGMARHYQQYLADSGTLRPLQSDNPNIGIRLEFLGGDKDRVLLWDRFIPMTTVAQVSAMLDELAIPNTEVIYYGWQPLGASTMPPNHLALEGGVGSVAELTALAERVHQAGGHVSLYHAPPVAMWGEAGYSVRNDVAMSITNVAMEAYGRHYHHLFTLAALRERYQPLAQNLATYPHIGLALDVIGALLYSDFRAETHLNREQTIAAYQEVLGASGVRLGLYQPNRYLWGVAQAYYDMPLDDNGYIYTTQTVPFLPIVLAGYLPYYGGMLNFSSDLQADLLRHVEYGAYPSFFLTQEPTANMFNTRSAWIYTSEYAQWGEPVRETYQWLNALLAPVRGQSITAHTALAQGVRLTTYANGAQIIVNYTDAPFAYRGQTIAAKDALLLEAE